jgi:septal ring factor EnvC (AmiA/AmiB activator)
MNKGRPSYIRPRNIPLIAAVLIGLSGPAQSQGISETRDLYKEVIKLRTLLSEERNQWQQEKANINDQLAIIREEAKLLEEKIQSLEDTVTTAETERGKVLDKIEEAKKAATVFSGVIDAYEKQASSLVVLLPAFVKQELAPLIQRLPKEGVTVRSGLSQRMQTVIALLTQIEKLNGTLTLNSEIKELPGGVTAEVKTLYVGLGIAYFSDADGRYGGYGRPGKNEWEWEVVEPAQAESIARAIAVFEAKREPAFVSLPAKID